MILFLAADRSKLVEHVGQIVDISIISFIYLGLVLHLRELRIMFSYKPSECVIGLRGVSDRWVNGE